MSLRFKKEKKLGEENSQLIQQVLDGIVAADDTAYAASWDGVTTIPPSKNTVYDAFDRIIFPLDSEGYSGFVHVTIYGQVFQVAFSDVNASVMWSFYVKNGGDFVLRIVHDGTGANNGKTAGGILYVSHDIDEGVGSWFISGEDWNIALGNAIDTHFANYGTPITIPDDSRVGCQWIKDNNAGGAAGLMNIYYMILVRQ